jgi:DNA-directed RNA polymerase specialized sigma24 family protein
VSEAENPRAINPAGFVSPFDADAWPAVDRRYRRALETFAIRLGLSDIDAEDVAQETLAALALAVRSGRFDPATSDVSSFLFGTARKRVALAVRKRYGALAPLLRLSDAWLDTIPETPRERAIWEQTWAISNLAHCLEIVRTSVDPARFRMFLMRIRGRRSIQDIAREEGVETIVVYKAVYEIKRRLHQLLKGLSHDSGAA